MAQDQKESGVSATGKPTGRPCFECGSLHTTDLIRCPACDGIREYHKHRLQSMVNVGKYFSQTAFNRVYGPETTETTTP